jgi:ABC-type glycerol-3-phosphate transport system permease component
MDQRIEKSGTRSINPWTVALVVAVLVLVVLVIGGYTLNWTWTGFKGNTLWDWLELLVLPAALAVAPLWIAAHEKRASRMTSSQQDDISENITRRNRR